MIANAAGMGWDISAAAYARNFSVSAQDTRLDGMFFKPDGLKMYIAGSTNDAVYEYDLSTAWNVSTASYVQNFSVAAQETSPRGLFFKPDGTKMFIGGGVGQGIDEYSLSAAWDISTASHVRYRSLPGNPRGLFFKPDGTKMFVADQGTDDVREYSLFTAWSVSSTSFVRSFSPAAQDASPVGVFFKPDGTRMYVSGSTNDAVYDYALSTAWDISTATYVKNFSVAAQTTSPVGPFFKPNGSGMYIGNTLPATVYEYRL